MSGARGTEQKKKNGNSKKNDRVAQKVSKTLGKVDKLVALSISCELLKATKNTHIKPVNL